MKCEIMGVNRDTGAEVRITVEATDVHHAEQQANNLGIMVSHVREVREQSPVAVESKRVPTPASTPRRVTCSTCGGSPLVRRRVHRLSGPAVAIGYILLIPSFLGILGSGILLLAPVIGLAGGAMSQGSAVEQLQQAGVEQAIIDKVTSEQPLTQADRDSLTPRQNDTVLNVTQSRAGVQAGACCCVSGILGVGAVIGLILSFVGGLLGWLLVMKKKVLQCTRCQTTVAAS